MQFCYIPNLYKGKYTSQVFCGSLPKLVEVYILQLEHGNKQNNYYEAKSLAYLKYDYHKKREKASSIEKVVGQCKFH